MQDLEKLIEAAVEYRIASLRADQHGIIGYQKREDYFQIFAEHKNIDIVCLLKGRKYQISKRTYDNGDFDYAYQFEIDGLKFITLVDRLLFEGDENKIEEES